MNPIGWVQGLQGPALIAVVCGLLFIEEVGVPLFFAPGDLVLAIGGIAISGGRVNAVPLVGALAVTIVVGGLLGREIFSLLGWHRLMRVAEPLHARGALERASGLLQRGGWRAVFTARLIPGLRVHTTQVAGVSRMPRLTYVAGLVPATVVYIGAFVGLGAAVGRPVLGLIHEAEHQVLLAAGLVLAAVIIFLLTREPVRRGLTSLYAAGWTGPLRFNLDSVRLVFILGALGLNFAGHAIAVELKLPLFLDSIGTILAGIVAGPWIGGSVGFISNLVSSNTVDPIAAPYGIVSFGVGFAAGLAGYLTWHRRWTGRIALWLVCFSIAAVVSTPLNFLISSGKSGVGSGDSTYALLVSLHMPGVLAAFLGEATVDLPDKLITVAAALLIVQGVRQPQPVTTRVELNLAEAFTFVVRSNRWVRRLLAAALCVLFTWLVVPYLLLSGYLIELSRRGRAGQRDLPSWNHKWKKFKGGVQDQRRPHRLDPAELAAVDSGRHRQRAAGTTRLHRQHSRQRRRRHHRCHRQPVVSAGSFVRAGHLHPVPRPWHPRCAERAGRDSPPPSQRRPQHRGRRPRHRADDGRRRRSPGILDWGSHHPSVRQLRRRLPGRVLRSPHRSNGRAGHVSRVRVGTPVTWLLASRNGRGHVRGCGDEIGVASSDGSVWQRQNVFQTDAYVVAVRERVF